MNSSHVFSICRRWIALDVDAAAAADEVCCSSLCCCSELSWTVYTSFLVSGVPKLLHFPVGRRSVLYFLSLLGLCSVLCLLDVIRHCITGLFCSPMCFIAEVNLQMEFSVCVREITILGVSSSTCMQNPVLQCSWGNASTLYFYLENLVSNCAIWQAAEISPGCLLIDMKLS